MNKRSTRKTLSDLAFYAINENESHIMTETILLRWRIEISNLDLSTLSPIFHII